LATVAGIRQIPGPTGEPVDAEPIGFRASAEHWNEYLLDDGSVLKLKLVVTEVLRVQDVYDQNGNPAYVAMHQQVTAVDSPDDLKRGNA
jgi:hypothetical protein